MGIGRCGFESRQMRQFMSLLQRRARHADSQESDPQRSGHRAARAGKEVNEMVHPELLESLAPTTENLAEASGTLAPGIPEIPGVPEMLPEAPAGSPAVPVPEDDIPLASTLAPASEPVAGSLPEVSAVFAELPAVPAEPA